MRYRFIRHSPNPVDEGCAEWELKECFMYCLPDVKERLDTFIAAKGDRITFEFEGQTVEIRREGK